MSRQILVCDDEAHILRAISLKLSRAGFDVKTVSDVQTCWRLLKRENIPDLLIVDESFPSGPGGLELVRWVRQDSRLVDLPVILLSSQIDVDGTEESLADLRLAQIVSKPFSPREMVEIAHLHLGEIALAAH